MVNNELKYMLDLAEYLSKDANYQYENMEWFVRWNLPVEIGEEWIDAIGIVNSIELRSVISEESLNILIDIIKKFEDAFEKDDSAIWSFEGMNTHCFWINQRLLAKKFLNSVAEKN